jgi:hypothetical protein
LIIANGDVEGRRKKAEEEGIRKKEEKQGITKKEEGKNSSPYIFDFRVANQGI